MRLKAIKYYRGRYQDGGWNMEGKPIDGFSNQWCTFDKINLVVGKNATGKTKTLNAVRILADLVSGDRQLSNLIYDSGEYHVKFSSADKEILYSLDFKDGKVHKEELNINNKMLLSRHEGGSGLIFFDKKEEEIEFQAPETQLVVATRRDSIQHPFFEELYHWGKSVRYYPFSKDLGQGSFLTDTDFNKDNINLKDPADVLLIFKQGEDRFGDEFIKLIKSDMEYLGYKIDNITIQSFSEPFKNKKIFGLVIKERELDADVLQYEISDGMFRSLSLSIHMNFSFLAKLPVCLLIDDIGEGLDYKRSSLLIDLLIDKSKKSSVQLIMATNNQFVMNKVDLEYWSIIKRENKKSFFYNYKNSQKAFDQFEFTGLDNFDFFSSNYFLKL